MRLLRSPLAPLALAACLLLPSAAAGQSVTAPAGFTPLFNGRDLTGWYAMEPDGPEAIAALSEEQRAAKKAAETAEAFRHWSVEDGQLVNDGKGPYLTTEREFGDIELLIDFRIAPRGTVESFCEEHPKCRSGTIRTKPSSRWAGTRDPAACGTTAPVWQAKTPWFWPIGRWASGTRSGSSKSEAHDHPPE